MKKLLYVFTTAILLIGVFATCNKDVAVTSVKLNLDSLTLVVGETKALIATVMPEKATNKSVVWTTNAPVVATITENGVITALSKGEATIVVTTVDGNFSASCKIKVENTPDGDITVTGVTLNKTILTLGIGESEKLIATVLPENAANKTVIWETSNPTIATVMANGLVTAISKGEATIVVTTVEGNFTANCTVKVDDVSVTGITLNKTTLTLDIGNSETLIATVLPENATNKTVIWATSDPLIATVDNGFVTAIGNGLATITVTTFEGNYSANCTVMIGYKLPVLTTLPATGILHDKATLGGNITDIGFPPYSERGICFSTTQNPTINNSKIIVTGSETGDYTGNATDLSDNTTYFARAYATNDLGTAYGNQISFTTIDLSQCASVRFDGRDKYTIEKIAVFNSDNVELASYNLDGVLISPYFVIPAGNHVPKYYIDSWHMCLPSPYTYNFKSGRKYTIVSHFDWGTITFSITDDGPR